MAKLILRDGGGGKEFDLEKSGSLTVGRSPDCDITIDDTQASRRHCQVAKADSGYEVSDLGSTNGTLVNSTLVKKQRLKHGDVIRIGAVEIAFDDPSSAGAVGQPAVGYLVYAKGDRKGQKVELSAQRTTIGRKATNTVVVDDAVSSSYHCEIVRGLNGYTIRDLGSTNGTLVNSEMITEAQLAHGARIRVGNTRFVFEDPAMAAIDLELAGAEDEDEWGMMRDIDLAAVRKRNPATIVYSLLFLAIVGSGGYFLWKGKPVGTESAIEQVKGNEIQDHSFEAETAADAWRGDPDGAVRVGPSLLVRGRGNQSLEFKASGAADVLHGRVSGDHVRYRLKGSIAARGAKARLGIRWVGGSGLERWVTVPAAGSSLSAVEFVASAPPWAQSAFPGVRIEGEGTVHLDDLSLVRDGEPQIVEATSNEFRIDVTDGQWIDVFHSTAPILVNGRAFTRDAEGHDAFPGGLTLKAEAQDQEHVLVTVEGAGDAPLAGIVLEEVSGYLSRGGFRAFTPNDEKKAFHASFPDDGTLQLSDVRKLLFGSGGRSFAAVPVEGRTLDAVARVEGTRRTVALLGAVAEGRFSLRFKVDLGGEKKLAETSMGDARDLHAARRWGEFLVKAQEVLAEFPFADKTQRDELMDLIRDVNKEYDDRRTRIDRLRKEYKDFKDPRDLEAAKAELADLERIFQIKPGDRGKGPHLVEAQQEVEALDRAAREQRETALAQPTWLNATLVDLRKDPPAVHSAAYQLFFIAKFLPNSKYAAQARAKLAEYPEIVQVLASLGFTLPPK